MEQEISGISKFPEKKDNLGRFPFNKNHRFKFSEFSLVEWNASGLGAFHSTKISGNSGSKSNGTDIFRKFVSKISVHLSRGAFHSTKISEISGPKLNGTVKIPGKVFENLGIRFECTLFDRISGIIENFVFHSQEISGLVSLPSVN